jgi:hypothetical protein
MGGEGPPADDGVARPLRPPSIPVSRSHANASAMIRYGADLFPVCRAAPYQAGACTAATYVRAAHHERGEHHPQAQQHSSRRTRPSRGDADADVPPTAPGHARHAAAAAASRPMIPPWAGEMIGRRCHGSSDLPRLRRFLPATRVHCLLAQDRGPGASALSRTTPRDRTASAARRER